MRRPCSSRMNGRIGVNHPSSSEESRGDLATSLESMPSSLESRARFMHGRFATALPASTAPRCFAIARPTAAPTSLESDSSLESDMSLAAAPFAPAPGCGRFWRVRFAPAPAAPPAVTLTALSCRPRPQPPRPDLDRDHHLLTLVQVAAIFGAGVPLPQVRLPPGSIRTSGPPEPLYRYPRHRPRLRARHRARHRPLPHRPRRRPCCPRRLVSHRPSAADFVTSLPPLPSPSHGQHSMDHGHEKVQATHLLSYLHHQPSTLQAIFSNHLV